MGRSSFLQRSVAALAVVASNTLVSAATVDLPIIFQNSYVSRLVSLVTRVW